AEVAHGYGLDVQCAPRGNGIANTEDHLIQCWALQRLVSTVRDPIVWAVAVEPQRSDCLRSWTWRSRSALMAFRTLGHDEIALEEPVEQCGGFGLVGWEEVAVEVEGDRDRAVAHVAAEGVGIDPGGDRHGGVEVPASVQRDSDQAGGEPGVVGSLL